MSSPTQRYSTLPPMPTHSDEDQFDYHYILEIDLRYELNFVATLVGRVRHRGVRS